MTVADLIYYLEGFDPEAEVHMAHQPNWPLDFEVSNVVECDDPEDNGKKVVYIVEGRWCDYVPGSVCEEIGWYKRYV